MEMIVFGCLVLALWFFHAPLWAYVLLIALAVLNDK